VEVQAKRTSRRPYSAKQKGRVPECCWWVCRGLIFMKLRDHYMFDSTYERGLSFVIKLYIEVLRRNRITIF